MFATGTCCVTNFVKKQISTKGQSIPNLWTKVPSSNYLMFLSRLETFKEDRRGCAVSDDTSTSTPRFVQKNLLLFFIDETKISIQKVSTLL